MFAMLSEISKLHHKLLDQQMNQTLFTLTMMTSMAIPMQLFTGMYGMNFGPLPEGTDEDPIPGLSTKYGFYYWFLGGTALSTMFLYIFFLRGRMS